MGAPVCYRAGESSGDPAVAPSFAALFFGAGAISVLTGALYREMLGPMGYAVILGLASLMGLVALSLLFLLRRNVLFAVADPEEGLLLRWGYGARVRVRWSDIHQVVRTRPTPESPETTLHMRVGGRQRVVFPPGPGQDELYELCREVLDGKRPKGRKTPKERNAGKNGPEAASADINGRLTLLWALLKLASLIVGGLFLVLGADRESPLETALFVAIAFEVVVPLSLFPPSGGAAVVRAYADAKGLRYQSILLGTRLIPWERLATARPYVPGRAGRMQIAFLEIFDVDGGRLLLFRPRNPQFFACLDRYLGTRLSRGD